MDSEARRTVERAARESRARLLAFLAARTRDVAAAEDALADAFRVALETWPASGVPQRPEAWLLTAARRRLIDAARHAQVHQGAVPTLAAITDAATEVADGSPSFPDERLKLMFVCAHPAIDAAARAPLMLQTVLGLDAARIASAFLVRPSAMGQRLSRAKAKIRDAGIAFSVPEPPELPARLEFVLDAIYAAYGSGWDDPAGGDARRRGLAAEAIELGRLVVALLPDAAEAKGLLALMLQCESRSRARRGMDGAYIPLSEQDPTLWDTAMIADAERILAEAERTGQLGRFQLEAAIQTMHGRRAVTGRTDWESIALLYEGLVRISPSVGALVGRAAAIAQAHGAAAGWAALEKIGPASSATESMGADSILTYQPYWAVSAHLLARLGRTTQAETAYERAIGLCEDAAMRDFLLRERAALRRPAAPR
jgi:RNA polymerase sigma-70 factor (ECF subfamily)